MWPPRKWAQRKPTGALVVFIQKGTPQRVAAKLRNIDYHASLPTREFFQLRAAQEELARRQGGKR